MVGRRHQPTPSSFFLHERRLSPPLHPRVVGALCGPVGGTSVLVAEAGSLDGTASALASIPTFTVAGGGRVSIDVAALRLYGSLACAWRRGGVGSDAVRGVRGEAER